MSTTPFATARDLLLNTSTGASVDDVVSVLSDVSRGLTTQAVGAREFSRIARALVDRVAPVLASAPPEVSGNAFKQFDSILLNGKPSVAFATMCSALTLESESAEVVARTLIMFVDRRIGGVDRLRVVVSAMENDESVAALVHLPSRILNVLHAEAVTEFKPTEVLCSEEYYGVLADAIYLQPGTNDQQGGQLLKDLLRRLIRMKQSNVLVNRWLSFGSVDRILSIMLKAPQNSIEHLVRSLLNVQTDRALEHSRVNIVLREVLLQSRYACEACVSRIPFQRPLLKRPRMGLKRLVKAIEQGGGQSAVTRGQNITADMWSREDFVHGADIQFQRQITRLLLYYLRRTAQTGERSDLSNQDSTMFTLVEGVHLRLAENDVRIQRHGMVVGEASSRHCNEEKPLKFEREGLTKAKEDDVRLAGDDHFEDGADSDFSDIAMKVGEELSDDDDGTDKVDGVQGLSDISGRDEAAVLATSSEIQAKEMASNQAIKDGAALEKKQTVDVDGEDFTCSRGKEAKTDSNIWIVEGEDGEGESVDDDWTSIELYELTSSSDEADMAANGETHGFAHAKTRERDYETIRKKIAAPYSVPRLLGLLRDVNKSHDGALKVDANTATAALRMVARRAEALFSERHTTLHACAIDLCLEVVAMDPDRYPDEVMGPMVEARKVALQRLLELDIVECGLALVEKVICGQHSDIGKRSECLAALSSAVRGATARAAQLAQEAREKEALVVAEQERVERMRLIGTVTRRVLRSAASTTTDGSTRASSFRGWDDEGLARLFQVLAWRLCRGGGADFLDIGKRDSQLWAQGIVALSVIASCAGVSLAGAQLRADVIEIAMEQVLYSVDADAVVRRGCALALGGVVEAMTEAEIDGRVVPGVGAGASGAGDGEPIGLGALVSGARRDEASAITTAADWLQRAAAEDGDVGVRRFAGRALGVWAARVGGRT